MLEDTNAEHTDTTHAGNDRPDRDQPLVSVVTPFYNTARYLAECIESVLAQSYQCFEYILVDNCSSDGSGEIAARYAQRDPRIRLIRRSELLPQVQNYNAALAEISVQSEYCKIVQADDFIFPECLRLMVQAFEQSESIGLVSAYDLKADVVRGSGFPYARSPLSGKETAQIYLREGIFPFGSPTTVMYRSSIVRGSQPFYSEGRLHEDTEKCMEILQHWDFAFVPHVLSFLRVDDASISAGSRSFHPDLLDRYIIVKRYSSSFLECEEAPICEREARKDYYQLLAHSVLRLRGRRFWQYHRQGLETIGEHIDWALVSFRVFGLLLWMLSNPGKTAIGIGKYVRSKRWQKK